MSKQFVNSQAPGDFTLFVSGSSIIVSFIQEPSRELSVRLGMMRMRASRLEGMTDVVSGVNSMAFFHEGNVDRQIITDLINNTPYDVNKEMSTHELEVCYDPRVAPDLLRVLNKLGISLEEFITLNTRADHYVACYGFLPGFVYIGGGDTRLFIPRKENPVPRVMAGAVSIAEQYTGVYPSQSPGGWHVIGNTRFNMLDYIMQGKAAWEPGDRVIMKSISYDQYLKNP
ncbi:MAG: carboxyltransferase domain-containing protein [Saprospiraceae bacterium]|nr:carboxyltransferase domain-containing protein [Saprospiraceae bacterium]